jgi:MFS family permease
MIARVAARWGRPRLTLASSGACHVVHDGYTDALYVLLPVWQQVFGLSLTQVGWLSTCMAGAMAGFQVPAGFLAERFGERLVLAVGTVVTALAYMTLGTAGGFTALATLLLIAGAGSGVQHPLASALVAQAYPADRRRVAIGLYNFTGDIGKVTFPFAAAVIMAVADWQVAVVVAGVAGLAVAVLAYPVYRAAGVGAPAPKPADGAPKMRGWGIRDRGGFGLLSAVFVIDTVVRLGFLVLLPFVLIAKGLATEDVGFALGVLFVGGAVGKFVCGFAADRIGVIATVFLTETLTGAGISAAALLPLPVVWLLLPLIGIALNGTSSVIYGSVADFADGRRHARVFALFYTFGVGAGAMAPAMVGSLSDWAGLTPAILTMAVAAWVTVPLAALLRAPLRRAAMAAVQS